MTERLTFGSGVMSDLMFGTTLRHNPGNLRGKVAARVSLEVVVKITDVAEWTLNTWGKATL
jgi:hypothetical protein